MRFVTHSVVSHLNICMHHYDSEFSLLAHDHSHIEVSRPCLCLTFLCTWAVTRSWQHSATPHLLPWTQYTRGDTGDTCLDRHTQSTLNTHCSAFLSPFKVKVFTMNHITKMVINLTGFLNLYQRSNCIKLKRYSKIRKSYSSHL